MNLMAYVERKGPRANEEDSLENTQDGDTQRLPRPPDQHSTTREQAMATLEASGSEEDSLEYGEEDYAKPATPGETFTETLAPVYASCVEDGDVGGTSTVERQTNDRTNRLALIVMLVLCCLIVVVGAVIGVIVALLTTNGGSAAESATPSPTGVLTAPPKPITPTTAPDATVAPTSGISAPEEIACDFIGHPSLTDCLTTLSFNSYDGGDSTNGPTIPSEIGLLTQMTALLLDGNELTGSIPPSISQLTKLAVLSFSNNSLTGSIPPSISDLTNLEQLWLDMNKLSGFIPSSVSNLNQLDTLVFFSNKLTGSIPDSVSSLTNLELLGFDYNTLTGSIPSSMSLLTSLTWLSLTNNELTGTIPFSLCEHVTDLRIDCDEIECSCCSDADETDCMNSESSNPVGSPTASPTDRKSVV